jgi:hypothetical protein
MTGRDQTKGEKALMSRCKSSGQFECDLAGVFPRQQGQLRQGLVGLCRKSASINHVARGRAKVPAEMPAKTVLAE